MLTGIVLAAEAVLNWGGLEAHPAVVNPVVPAGDVISLRGEWSFSLPERDLPNRNGVWGNFSTRQSWGTVRGIQVPGCWEAQGVGEPGKGESWDPQWDENSKPIRHKYMGEGWYRREVEIPAAWKGKRIWIKFGGVKSVGWVWVNDRQVAMINNYCATEKYDITAFVRPGEKAKIVVDVDNRKPSRKGLMSALHRWGGIYRDVELEATPFDCWIDDAWVRGDYTRRVAEVKVEGGQMCAGLSLRATVEGESSQIPLSTSTSSPSPSTFTLEVPLRHFRPWSPENPNLYTAKVELVSADGTVLQTRCERFGIRRFEVRGRDFYLNGRPFYLRGFGDDFVYPLTGMSPADREIHRAHLQKAKDAGFNFVRLHTHAEYPEYFEAADEVGIMIQPELPYYSDVPCEGFEFDPPRDVKELWRNYRRHPSFAVYSMGNEGSFGDALDRGMHELVKAMDPDRLKINQDSNQQHLNAPDRSDYSGGPIRIWERGSFDPARPFVTHEYLNLCVKSDSRLEEKFTGVWQPPVTRADRAAWLAASGLGLEWGDRLQNAQHALQAIWQKRGIEAARKDPFCRGYSFWTIVDVVVYNPASKAYSAQGLFDPFWGDKPCGLTAAGFAEFNSPSCTLVDFEDDRRVYQAGDEVAFDVLFANYTADLADAKLEWRLLDLRGGRTIGSLPMGAARKIAAVRIPVPEIAKPVKAALSVSVAGVENRWPLWLFPRQDSAAVKAKAAANGIVIAAKDSAEAKAALANGAKLITVDGDRAESNEKLGWWWMGPQVGTAIRSHPALGSFPCGAAMDELFFRLVRKGGLELPAAGVKEADLIIVGEGGEHCYLYLAERQLDRSRVLECHGLDLLAGTVEATALLDAFVDYLVNLKQPN